MGHFTSALALEPVQQDTPANVTRSFHNIEALCNGSRVVPEGIISSHVDDRRTSRHPNDDGNTGPLPQNPTPVYRIANGITVRREAFGCIVLNPNTKAIACYNQPGFSILRHLHRPITLEMLRNLLIKDGFANGDNLEDVAGFVNHLRVDGMCVAGHSPEATAPRFIGLDWTNLQFNYYNRPIGATIELTYGCFRRCTHCMYSSSPEFNTTGDLSLQQWATILDKLWDCGVMELYFSGGEIFWHPEAWEIIQYADHKGFLLTIVSDLTGYNTTRIQQIASLQNLWGFRVSLDGATSDSHDALRGKGGFLVTTRNLRLMAEAGIPVGVNAQVHRKNLDEFSDIGLLTLRLGAFAFTPCITSPIGRGAGLETDTLSNDELQEVSVRYARLITETPLRPFQSIWEMLAPKVLRGEVRNPLRDWQYIAQGGTHQLHVSPTGDCHPSPKLQGTKYQRVGNLLSDSLEEVWASPLLDELRTHVKRYGYMVGVNIRAMDSPISSD